MAQGRLHPFARGAHSYIIPLPCLHHRFSCLFLFCTYFEVFMTSVLPPFIHSSDRFFLRFTVAGLCGAPGSMDPVEAQHRRLGVQPMPHGIQVSLCCCCRRRWCCCFRWGGGETTVRGHRTVRTALGSVKEKQAIVSNTKRHILQSCCCTRYVLPVLFESRVLLVPAFNCRYVITSCPKTCPVVIMFLALTSSTPAFSGKGLATRHRLLTGSGCTSCATCTSSSSSPS